MRRMVVVGYFGLFGRRPRTLAQLSERAQISRSRIGQILSRALRDLRLWCAQAEAAERLAAAQIAVLGLAADNFLVHVFDLGHDVSGLVGLNFLSLLNYESPAPRPERSEPPLLPAQPRC